MTPIKHDISMASITSLQGESYPTKDDANTTASIMPTRIKSVVDKKLFIFFLSPALTLPAGIEFFCCW